VRPVMTSSNALLTSKPRPASRRTLLPLPMLTSSARICQGCVRLSGTEPASRKTNAAPVSTASRYALAQSIRSCAPGEFVKERHPTYELPSSRWHAAGQEAQLDRRRSTKWIKGRSRVEIEIADKSARVKETPPAAVVAETFRVGLRRDRLRQRANGRDREYRVGGSRRTGTLSNMFRKQAANACRAGKH
jgi:hypothetical protein